MSVSTDKDILIQELLQQRDELYAELSRLWKADDGTLDSLEAKNKELEDVIKEQGDKIRKLTDQLSWYRRKMWSSSSERFIPQHPDQRKIDFEFPSQQERPKPRKKRSYKSKKFGKKDNR